MLRLIPTENDMIAKTHSIYLHLVGLQVSVLWVILVVIPKRPENILLDILDIYKYMYIYI